MAPVLDLLRNGGVALEEIAPARAAEITPGERTEDCIIVAGGDGTIHHTAPMLLAAGKPFGIIPLGTANDLARSLDIPPDPMEAAKIILAGRTRLIDVGDVNNEPFFNVASLGISVELAHELTRETKRRFGAFSYIVAGARALMRARRFRASIAINGRVWNVRTFQIAVGNGRYYGGGVSVHEECRIGDGKLYFYSLEMRSIWKLALMVLAFRSGAHGAWQDVRTDAGEHFIVHTKRPQEINADGEIVTRTPATFTIRRKVLEVFAPPCETDSN
jgi:diacylglycerol kinase (ATP)